MGRVSDHWTSLQDLDCDSKHAQKVNKVLTSADFVHLSSVALQTRYDEDFKSNTAVVPPSPQSPLTCTIDTSRFAVGYNNIVIEVTFSDSLQWIARIRLPDDDEPEEKESLKISIMSEIATIQLVTSRTSIPVPKIYAFNVDADNPFGFRYVLMQALPGHHPDRGLANSIPREHWDKVVDQLSDYWHQLSRLRFNSIGRLWRGCSADENEPTIIPVQGLGGPFLTSWEYLRALRRWHSAEIEAEHASDKEWQTSAWILEQAVPSMIIDEYLHGPFPLCHMDFHFNNILIDDEFNITGIIDWSDAQTVPVERFTITPELITFPGLSAAENEPIVTFREKFAAALKNREMATIAGGEAARETSPPSSTLRFISDLIGTPRWEIMFRSTYSYPWRARSDARLVLKQMYGADAKWEDFVSYFENGPVNQNQRPSGTRT